MTIDPTFSGFAKGTVRFFVELRRNNNRDWFEKHRPAYEAEVMEPAKAFVTAMGARLRVLAPKVAAIPRVNKSIFRLNRDTRFSMDPTPYKTNLGLYFWEGGRSKMEASGFYFHLEPPKLLLAGGIYMLPKERIDRYRRAVVDPKQGRELSRIIAEIKARKGFALGGLHYKRIPAGYDATHPNADLLKHDGLHAMFETRIPEEFYSSRLIDYCFEKYALLVPLHRWLVKALFS